MINNSSWMLRAFLGLVTISLISVSCEKDDDDNENTLYTLRGNANAAQETPTRPNSTATGTIAGSYDSRTNIMQYTITWTGLTSNATNMHFHGPDDPGETHPNNIQKPIPGFTSATSGSISRADTLTDTNETELLQGRWYYNIHTPNYPAGEIRGQVFAVKQ